MTREQWRIFGATPKTGVIDGESVDLRFFGFIRGKEPQALLRPNARKKLAVGLLAIPAKGPVTREQFDVFAHAFLAAGFKETMLGTASRLLSVWRPDRFAPCNRGSRAAFRSAIQAPMTTLNDYFEAHALLWDMEWAKAAKPPKSPALAIWRARVAPFDVLFYEVPV